MHVELLRYELCTATSDLYIEKMVQEMASYQDNFEVYIQTLISQALDANFLTEISQEQGSLIAATAPSKMFDFLRFRSVHVSLADVYFLSNVKIVDDVSAARRERLLRLTSWPQHMVQSMSTWPCFSVLTELGMMNTNQIFCAGCNQRGIASRMILYGQAYDPSTIQAVQPDNRITYDKVRTTSFPHIT